MGHDSSVWQSYVLLGQYLSLYGYSDQRLDFVPRLARELPPKPVQEGDFWTITVEMVDNATWSDGEPIDAHDVAFTANTALDLQLTGNWPGIFKPEVLDHAEAADDFTVKYFFTDKPGLSQWQYGVAQAPIVAKHFWEAMIEEARAFSAGVEPPVEPGEDATEEELATFEEASTAYENVRETLYGFVVEDEPTAGAYSFQKWEPGAFVQNDANLDWYFNGSEIVEYDDGTYVLNTADGRQLQIYGAAEGEETLRFNEGPYAPNVIFTIYGDQNAAFLALLSGEVDYILNPLGLARGLREQAQQGEGINTYENEANGLFYLAFNMRKEPMNDPAFRKALDIIIDKEFVTGRILQAAVIPLHSVVPPGNNYWHNPDVPTPFVGLSREERVNLAVETLKEAGWSWSQEPFWAEDRNDVVPGEGLLMPNGSPMPELTILGPGSAYDPLRATFNQWVSEWARELGMSVESELTGFNAILDPVFVSADFDMYILGWGLFPFADHPVRLFHSRNDTAVSGGLNTPGIANPDLDALLETFESSTDVEEARDLIFEIQVLLTELRPYIPLFTNTVYDLARDNIKFPYTHVLDGIQDVSGLQSSSQVLLVSQ